jgi:hypothetical protein
MRSVEEKFRNLSPELAPFGSLEVHEIFVRDGRGVMQAYAMFPVYPDMTDKELDARYRDIVNTRAEFERDYGGR